MKKILTLLLVLSMILALAACGGKSALSVKEFNSRVTSLGYELDDVPSQDALTGMGIKEASAAYLDTDEGYVEIEYAVFQDKDALNETFADFAEEFEEEEGYEKTSGSGWEQYRLRDGNEVVLVIRVDNAMMYLESWRVSDAEIDKLLDKLGY